MTAPAYNAVMFRLRSFPSAWLRSRPTALARATLAAWLLVLFAGLFTPWVQARSLDAVCSGAGHRSYMLAPHADGLAHALHGLDCPQCMPQLAAPPPKVVALLAAAPHADRPLRPRAMACTPVPSACPPPARGPPV